MNDKNVRKVETGTDQLLCSVANHVATILLNNPQKKNALSDQLTPALRQALLDVESDPDVRVVVVRGAGNAFCAGGDISGMGDNLFANKALSGGNEKPSVDAITRQLQHAQETVSLRLYELNKPTVAVLTGPAAGAGMSIALACDLRIATDKAFITTAFGAIGLSGDFGGSWYLSKLVGPAKAKELYFTSRRVLADEAEKLGIFNHVVSEDRLEEQLEQMVGQIAASAPIALSYMKENINRAQTSDLKTAMTHEAQRMVQSMHTQDHKSAAKAFLEKRYPVFKGH